MVAEPQPVQMPDIVAQEEKKVKGVIKAQRILLDDVESHIEDIMELVDINEDYGLKKRHLIDDNREGEKIFKYELNTKATINTICCGGGARKNYKYLSMTRI